MTTNQTKDPSDTKFIGYLLLLGGVIGLVFFPPAGVIIVSFTNNTTSPVQFFAYESAEALDPTVDSRNFSVEVEAGERLNEVLDCPIGLVCPGSLAADFSRETLAALVLSTGDEVNYEGVVLTQGQEFTCGDIIDIQLDPPAAAAGNYLFTVRVVPGR